MLPPAPGRSQKILSRVVAQPARLLQFNNCRNHLFLLNHFHQSHRYLQYEAEPVVTPGAAWSFSEVMCCRAGFGHSVWWQSAQHVNRTHYAFIWFTAHINTDWEWSIGLISFHSQASFPASSCSADSMSMFYSAAALSHIYISDLRFTLQPKRQLLTLSIRP